MALEWNEFRILKPKFEIFGISQEFIEIFNILRIFEIFTKPQWFLIFVTFYVINGWFEISFGFGISTDTGKFAQKCARLFSIDPFYIQNNKDRQILREFRYFLCREEDVSRHLGAVHIFVQIRLCTSFEFSPVSVNPRNSHKLRPSINLKIIKKVYLWLRVMVQILSDVEILHRRGMAHAKQN